MTGVLTFKKYTVIMSKSNYTKYLKQTHHSGQRSIKVKISFQMSVLSVYIYMYVYLSEYGNSVNYSLTCTGYYKLHLCNSNQETRTPFSNILRTGMKIGSVKVYRK